MATTSSPRRVQRVRHELKRRELEVRRVENVSRHFRSVVLGGEALADFVSASFDDHVKVLLELGGAEPVMRDYTPRAFDPARLELTLEFALHGDGPAALWAEQARVGQTLVVGGPRGSFIIPMDYDWHLLAGDETGLPAIARRLEELPEGTPVIALLLVTDPADQRIFKSGAQLNAQWFSEPETLLTTARALSLPPGEGYIWCAGEAATMAALRKIFVDEKGHDRHAIRAAAYWKRGVSDHHENLE